MKDKFQDKEGIEKVEQLRKLVLDNIYEGMGRPQEFKINELLSLQLRGEETYIMINNKTVNMCKYLLMNIPLDEIESYDFIDSIDEASEHLDSSMEEQNFDISKEAIFWGHCSNLQAWYESGYDTRLLHRTLAFPLLKKLAEAGDFQAQQVFKEEVARRFSSGHLPVVEYLLQEGYLATFTPEEAETLFTSSNIVSILLNTIFQKNESPHRILAHELLLKLVKIYESVISRLIIEYQANIANNNH